MSLFWSYCQQIPAVSLGDVQQIEKIFCCIWAKISSYLLRQPVAANNTFLFTWKLGPWLTQILMFIEQRTRENVENQSHEQWAIRELSWISGSVDDFLKEMIKWRKRKWKSQNYLVLDNELFSVFTDSMIAMSR